MGTQQSGPSLERIRQMSLAGTTALYQAVPDCQLDELLSAVFTMTYHLVSAILHQSSTQALEQNKATITILIGRLFELTAPAKEKAN